jgi:hypothetical protein
MKTNTNLFGHPVLFKTRNHHIIYHLLWWFTKMFYHKENWNHKFNDLMKHTKMISFQLMQPKNPFKWFIRVMTHSSPSYSRKNLIIGDRTSFGLMLLSPLHSLINKYKDKLELHQWIMKRDNVVYHLCNHCEKGKIRDYYTPKYPECINYDSGRNNISCKKFKEIKIWMNKIPS